MTSGDGGIEEKMTLLSRPGSTSDDLARDERGARLDVAVDGAREVKYLTSAVAGRPAVPVFGLSAVISALAVPSPCETRRWWASDVGEVRPPAGCGPVNEVMTSDATAIPSSVSTGRVATRGRPSGATGG